MTVRSIEELRVDPIYLIEKDSRLLVLNTPLFSHLCLTNSVSW